MLTRWLVYSLLCFLIGVIFYFSFETWFSGFVLAGTIILSVIFLVFGAMKKDIYR
jgi:hypothetical protein